MSRTATGFEVRTSGGSFLGKKNIVYIAEQGFPERLVQSLVFQEKMQFRHWTRPLRILRRFEC